MQSYKTLLSAVGFFLLNVLSCPAQSGVWLQDSLYQARGIPGTPDFDPETRTYFLQYDDRQRPLETLSQRTNSMGEWTDWRRRQFAYDGDELERLLIQYWDASTASWEDVVERIFDYADDGNLQQKTYRRAPGLGLPLANRSRWTYSYDEQGNLQTVLFQRHPENEWEDVSRQLWTYTPEGRVQEQTQQRMQGGAWENARRRVWLYDEVNGMIQSITEQVWSSMQQAWQNHSRQEYTNSEMRQWNAIRRQTWDAATGQWENEQRELFDYGTNTRLNSRVLQRWDNGEWKNRFRGAYQLEGTTINGLFERSPTGGNDWQLDSRFQTVYDDSFQQQLSQGWQSWNAQMERWENNLQTIRIRNFWSEQVVSSTQNPASEILCTIPNPYRLNTSLNCPEMEPGSTYSLQVFNLVGQPVFQRQIRGGDTFSISGNIPAGLYVLHWRKDNRPAQVWKLMIVNN